MKQTLGILCIISAFITLSGCKESAEDETPIVKTKTQLLTTGSWMMSDWVVNDVSDWKSVNVCSKDDFSTFKSNGTVINDEGALLCVTGVPQTNTENWSFNAGETKIVIDGDTSDLKLLTENEMAISFKSSFEVTVIKFKKK
jgi:hypothetical protein